MKTYLLTWNPKRWKWLNIEKEVAAIQQNGFIEESWSCGRNKSIIEGDRIFLLRQCLEPRGIVASGWAISAVSEGKHFDPKSDKSTALYTQVRFDVLLNPDSESIYPRQTLETGKFLGVSHMHWDSQASGIKIPADVATILETEWADFLLKKKLVQGSGRPSVTRSPDEVADSKNYYEGATKSVRVNAYERNDKARLACIKHYGLSCCICGFNFEEAYGEMGVGFIHIHHLKPLSEIGEAYQVDPVKDLRPVCPNCHAMIHIRKKPFSMEEVKQRLRK